MPRRRNQGCEAGSLEASTDRMPQDALLEGVPSLGKGGPRVARGEEGQHLGASNAAQPTHQGEFTAAAKLAKGVEVVGAVPEAQAFSKAVHGRQRSACNVVVDDPGDVHPRAHQQLLRGRDACVALDHLELTVPRVELELDVSQALEVDAAEELLAQSCRLGNPGRLVVAAAAEN